MVDISQSPLGVPDEVELTRDVGSGFRMVIKSLPTGPGAFESVAQYHYLFYKDIELGQYDSYSVAPSGKYALLQDSPTGDIVLFASVTTQTSGGRQVLRLARAGLHLEGRTTAGNDRIRRSHFAANHSRCTVVRHERAGLKPGGSPGVLSSLFL
jgi:hypothetical protein